MILVLVGRSQDREIVDFLELAGYTVELIDLTDKGKFYQWAEIIDDKRFRVVIDASHPFSEQPSQTIRELCEQKRINYLRYSQREADLPEHSLIHKVDSWEAGAKKAAEIGQTIFLTTGSNNLEIFLAEEQCRGKRIVIRVLPDYKVIKKCQDLGFAPKDIVAMQGPFSKELNKSTFKAYGASVVVTRESGKRGGADNKIAAALALKIPVVVIRKKPSFEGGEVRSHQEILATLQNRLEN